MTFILQISILFLREHFAAVPSLKDHNIRRRYLPKHTVHELNRSKKDGSLKDPLSDGLMTVSDELWRSFNDPRFFLGLQVAVSCFAKLGDLTGEHGYEHECPVRIVPILRGQTSSKGNSKSGHSPILLNKCEVLLHCRWKMLVASRGW
jgi:hypothetical protein